MSTLERGRHTEKVLYLMTIGYMAVIFHLSSLQSIDQPGPFKDFPSVDKLEHLSEFFILGLLMFLSFHFTRSTRIRRYDWMLALYCSLLYALMDEVHQSFVPGRSPDMIDLLADGAGIATACFIGAWMSTEQIFFSEKAIIRINDGLFDAEE